MNLKRSRLLAFLVLSALALLAQADSVYESRTPSSDGTGRVYMGREISFVLGHRGIRWLERDERQTEERPDLLIELIDLAPDTVIADIGAGSGYFTFRLQPEVPKGKVLAIDIQPEMLAAVEAKQEELGVRNVETVLGTVTDPNLPDESIDAALMVDAYHEFSHPREMMQGIVRALAPGGRVYLVEYRAEDPAVPMLPLHKMTEEQARLEMSAVGLEFVENLEGLPWQHILVFEKPDKPAAASWNQWRGPRRDGSVPGDDWPADLEGLELQWRVGLGEGYPGPIVSGDRVFVVETVDKKTVAARALDRSTGETLWTRSWPGTGRVPFFAAANGDWVRSTPAYDGKTLFLGDMSEALFALDGETGEERWRVAMTERFETAVPDFGFASSPLLDDAHLYVQAANSLVKLDKETGATVWRALEDSGRIQQSGAFSSPVAATIEGERQIVTLTRTALYGVDPESGDELWSRSVPSFRGMHILTPVVADGSIFTSPYRQRSFRYAVKREGESMRVEQAWENKSTGYMSSPVLIDGHVYMHLGNGRLECIELETGESRWRSEPLGKYWSMVYQGDKILALDQAGTLYLIRANPEAFEMLDSRKISDQETWGHLAISGDGVFVRELEGVAAFRWPN